MRSLFLILLFFNFYTYGQDLSYAKKLVDTLASTSLHGRGYVNEGDKLAADFIANEFGKLKLKKYASDYFQSFTFSVNTFPSKMQVKLNDKVLSAGEDFLIDSGSPGIKGNFDLVFLSAREILSDKFGELILAINKNQLLAIDLDESDQLEKAEKSEFNERLQLIRYTKEVKLPGIILFSNKKLTWSASQYLNPRTVFTIKREKPTTDSKLELNIKNKFIDNYSSNNVIGYVEGSKNPDSLIVFSAHYDHLGRMGEDAYFPGANDNASGVALVTDFARFYSIPENQPKYSIAFMAFAAEELGLLGSRYFVDNPYFDLKKIKFMLNFDISGTGDDGIQVVNGKVFKKEFNLLKSINDENELLKQVKIRGEACNSDHCFFYRKGVPSFFIYTLGGIQAYHDIYDKAETLPLTEYEDYFELITRFVGQLE